MHVVTRPTLIIKKENLKFNFNFDYRKKKSIERISIIHTMTERIQAMSFSRSMLLKLIYDSYLI